MDVFFYQQTIEISPHFPVITSQIHLSSLTPPTLPQSINPLRDRDAHRAAGIQTILSGSGWGAEWSRLGGGAGVSEGLFQP